MSNARNFQEMVRACSGQRPSFAAKFPLTIVTSSMLEILRTRRLIVTLAGPSVVVVVVRVLFSARLQIF